MITGVKMMIYYLTVRASSRRDPHQRRVSRHGRRAIRHDPLK